MGNMQDLKQYYWLDFISQMEKIILDHRWIVRSERSLLSQVKILLESVNTDLD